VVSAETIQRRDLVPVPERVKIVMAMLNAAAERGDFCPDNATICTSIGGSSLSTGANIIKLLETMNLIRVDRGHRNRVVTIVATGKCTAGKVRVAHPRAGQRKYQWNEDQDAQLMDLLADDATLGEAAMAMCLPYRTVLNRFNDLASALNADGPCLPTPSWLAQRAALAGAIPCSPSAAGEPSRV
jgi:hypothetical protein